MPLEDPSLPLVHRIYAHPTGNRACDTTNIYLRGQLAQRWENDERMVYGARRDYQLCHNEDVRTLFFQAILLRFTGRTKRFETYQEYMSEVHRKTVAQLPFMEDLEDYLNFVRHNLPSRMSSLSRWISDQHRGAIPPKLQQVEGFSAFMREVKANLPRLLSKILPKVAPGGPGLTAQAEAHKHITMFLADCAGSTDESLFQFMAQLVQRDVEEFYEGLFEEPDESTRKQVVSAFGSKEGVKPLLNQPSRTTYQPNQKQDVRTLLFEAILVSFRERVDKFEAYQEYMKEFHQKEVREECSCSLGSNSPKRRRRCS